MQRSEHHDDAREAAERLRQLLDVDRAGLGEAERQDHDQRLIVVGVISLFANIERACAENQDFSAQSITHRYGLSADPLARTACGRPDVPGDDGPSLAELVTRYHREIDAINRSSGDADEAMDNTVRHTEAALAKATVRTPEDAIAALDWLIVEGVNLGGEYKEDAPNSFEAVVGQMIDQLRGYLERAAS